VTEDNILLLRYLAIGSALQVIRFVALATDRLQARLRGPSAKSLVQKRVRVKPSEARDEPAAAWWRRGVKSSLELSTNGMNDVSRYSTMEQDGART
jgi:hypothetical protein